MIAGSSNPDKKIPSPGHGGPAEISPRIKQKESVRLCYRLYVKANQVYLLGFALQREPDVVIWVSALNFRLYSGLAE